MLLNISNFQANDLDGHLKIDQLLDMTIPCLSMQMQSVSIIILLLKGMNQANIVPSLVP